MAEWRMYSKYDCPWCERARDLLEKKGIVFTEFKLGEDYTRDDLRELLPADVEKLTVPRIFRDGKHIGGYSDLVNYFDEVL
jgi:glutaredoxin 3